MLDLKIYLIKRKLPQYQLAAKLGITQQYMSDIVHGKRRAKNIRMRMVQELGFPASVVALSKSRTKAKGVA